jgi:hypothetical protein
MSCIMVHSQTISLNEGLDGLKIVGMLTVTMLLTVLHATLHRT